MKSIRSNREEMSRFQDIELVARLMLLFEYNLNLSKTYAHKTGGPVEFLYIIVLNI